MDTKDTDKKKKYRYYIVELSHPIKKDEKFIYVPESWVIDKVDGSTTIILRYPRGVTEAVLEKMKSDMRDLKDNTFDGWATIVVNVKHVTNNKKFAKNYTKKFNKGENMLFQNTNSGKPCNYGTLSFEETSRKPEPIISSQRRKNNEYETFKATSGFDTEASLIEAISKHLSLTDSDREKNNKLNADETASFTELPTKCNATGIYSHFSTDLKKDPTTSDKCHNKNYLLMNISKDISDHDFEKSGEFENIYSNHLPTYHYTPELTNNPLKMKFLRKPAKPANTISLKELLVGSGAEKTATTENNTAENLSQELKYHLTKDIVNSYRFQISVDKQGPSIHIDYLHQKSLARYNTKKSSSVDIERNAESKYNDINKPNDEEDQSKIINEAYLNFAYLKKLNALRLRLNNIFEDLTHLDVAKVRSEMKERFKKLENLNNQYFDEPVITSSEEPAPMELEEKDVGEVVIEPARDSEKSQTALNEIVHEKEAQQFSKPKSIKISQLPKHYDKNDSKWTLRYRKKAEGLVELEEGSGVYVSGKTLFNCKSLSKGSREFARRLLLEVFSLRALGSCCLYGVKSNGQKIATKLGLDAHAREVLFAAVENHARERNWEPLNTKHEIKIHRRKIEMTIRNRMNNLRRKSELL